jgi:hypothetical protein
MFSKLEERIGSPRGFAIGGCTCVDCRNTIAMGSSGRPYVRLVDLKGMDCHGPDEGGTSNPRTPPVTSAPSGETAWTVAIQAKTSDVIWQGPRRAKSVPGPVLPPELF